jgi:AcrR family transcriptional regulator
MSKRAAKARIKDARHAVYREHILDAAEQIFAEQGYDDAKVVAMATAAGVSLATVYRSFAAKWDIYRAVHARRTEALYGHVRARAVLDGGPLALLLGGITAYIEFHMRNPNYLKMHLRDGYAWSSSNILLSPEQTSAWNQGLIMIVHAFEGAIRAGHCIPDERSDLMARTMIAMHQVRLADWVDRGMKESVEHLTAAVHREFVRTFCTAKGATAAQKLLKRLAA